MNLKKTLKKEVNLKNIIIYILSVLTLTSVILFWKSPIFLTLVLFLLGFLMLYILKDKTKILVFIFCSISGAISEILAIHFGVWSYSKTNLLGIPFWLVPLWGVAALFMINLNETINNLFKK